MIGMKDWKLVVAVLAILSVTPTVQAWAHDFGRGGGGPAGDHGGGGHGVLHFGGLVEELIFPCRNDCDQAERSCTETAESALLICAATTCDATIQLARTDCSASRTSAGCLTDVSTLMTCVQPCVTTDSAADKLCAATFKTCVAACSPTPTPTP